MIQFISVIVILFIQTQMTLTMVEAQYRTTGKEQTNNNNNNNRNNRNKEDRTGKLENVAYVCAGFPWMYGPYQMQGDQLMKELSNKGKYPQYDKMFWMFRGSNAHGIPQGKYTAEEISKLAPPQVPKMPKQWDAKHLTFLGLPKRTKLTEVVARINGAAVSISEINDAAKLYSIDAFIVLGDINVVYHDAYDFNVPTVAWVPFHYNTVRGSNRALLKPYTHVIGLAPSTAKVIKDVRADVSYLPHFIDANVIRKDAKNWLAKERKTLLTQKENKNKTDREIVFDANKYDSMFKRRANDFKAVEENNDEDDVFLVLASGVETARRRFARLSSRNGYSARVIYG